MTIAEIKEKEYAWKSTTTRFPIDSPRIPAKLLGVIACTQNVFSAFVAS